MTQALAPCAQDDAELVRRIAHRDERAFEALMRRHNRLLYRIARSILKDEAEAEDAVQEAYFAAYRNIGSFRGGAALSTWLARIVSKGASKDVKAFGKQMVTDHTGVNKQAVALVTKLKVTPEDNPTSQSLKSGGVANVKDLGGLTGAAFDKAYIEHEIAYHQQVLDAIDKTLVPNAKNAELKALIVKVRPAFVGHLEHAKKIQASLKG